MGSKVGLLSKMPGWLTGGNERGVGVDMQVFTCVLSCVTRVRPTAKRLDSVFRAIAHPGRRRLLTRLGAESGLTLSELSARLPVTRQAVSQHLELLEEAGLVVTRWHGREKLHYLNPTPLAEAHDAWLAPLISREARALVALREKLESAEGRSSGKRAQAAKRRRRA